MKRSLFIKCAAACLCLLMLIPVLACTKDDSTEETIKGLTWENEYLRGELDTANAALASANAELLVYQNATPVPVVTPEPYTPAPSPEPEIVEKTVEVPIEYAFGVNCLINGAKMVPLNGKTSLSVKPELPAGTVFESWLVNGQSAGTDATLQLTADSTTLVEAICHPEKKLTCIKNCYFQYENDRTRAAGEKLKEVVFEYDYVNPNTKKTCPGGKLDGYVQADVPKNKAVDYWIINGVEYHFNNEVRYIHLIGVDAPVSYEVVLKSAPKKKTDSVVGSDPTPYRRR